MGISVAAPKPDSYRSLFYCCFCPRDLDLGRPLAFMPSEALGPSLWPYLSADISLSIL